MLSQSTKKAGWWIEEFLPPRGAIADAEPNKVMNASGLVMTYTPGRNHGGEGERTPSNFAEAAVGVLGACLLLYKQYVPHTEYYEVHHMSER
jgi:hypothetical protein